MINDFINFAPDNFNQYVSMLQELNYFEVPASTRFHGKNNGDLYRHSKKVTEVLLDYTDKLNLQWQRKESPYIIGLFHDLCKTKHYEYINGVWTINKLLQQKYPGHAEASLQILCEYNIKITDEERQCILYHMGAFVDKSHWQGYTKAVKQNQNVLYTHTADMIASQVLGI